MSSLVKVNQYGQLWVFGFQAADAPTIANFAAKEAEVTYEPETDVTEMDGEGSVDSLVISKPAYRKATARFTGNILTDFDAESLSESFAWQNRRWFIKPMTVPRTAGAMSRVTIEAVSHPGIPV